jgi:hypothetical protein
MSENVLKTQLTCPHCQGEITIERPAPIKRGMLLGVELADMTLVQLKREKINAGSVLYKATKRGAPAELIAKNQARVDAVKAALEALGVVAQPKVIVIASATVTATATATATEVPAESAETTAELAQLAAEIATLEA